MHASAIAPQIIESVNARRGQSVPIRVDPAKTAHVVVDLQVGFIAPGAFAEVPVAGQIVPQVNKVSAALREAGGTNVFIRFKVDLDEPEAWPSMWDRMSQPALDAMVHAFAEGADQYALWPGLDVAPQDLIVDKTRFSAFIPGTCQLHEILQAKGVDTLIVTGTVTNCCCESTARDAMQMGYKVLFVQDGAAAFDDVTADEAIARIKAGAAQSAAV